MRSAGTFVLVGLLLFGALHELSDTVAPPYAKHGVRWERFLDRAGGIRALVVGSSHSGAVDLEELGLEGYYLHRGGLDLFETRFVLERALRRADGVEVVLLALSYGSLQHDNARMGDSQVRDLRRQLHHTHAGLGPIDGDAAALVQGKLAALVRTDHWRGVFAGLAGAAEVDERVGENGRISLRELDPSRSPPRGSPWLAQHAENRVGQYVAAARRAANERPDLEADCLDELRAIAAAVDRAGARLVLFTPPYSREYTDAYDAAAGVDARRRTSDRVRALADGLEGADYHDFSTDERFAPHQALFRDSDHLTTAAARRFSRALKARIDR